MKDVGKRHWITHNTMAEDGQGYRRPYGTIWRESVGEGLHSIVQSFEWTRNLTRCHAHWYCTSAGRRSMRSVQCREVSNRMVLSTF